MALTYKQKTEVLTRLANGERSIKITSAMGIERKDLQDLKQENKEEFQVARQSKTARLARLNGRKERIETELSNLNAEIAAVEAE